MAVEEIGELSHEIVTAVDRLLEIHQKWADNPDPDMKAIPPGQLEDAANALFELIAYADVPAQLRGLVHAVEKFQVEWGMYETGAREKDGGPKNSLWRALREVIAARQVSAELRIKRPEPIRVLLDQKVSHNQIAFEIYGYDGKGPFVKNGQAQVELIEREGKEPGSVIPKDWIPPYEEARLRRHHIHIDRMKRRVDEQIERTTPKPQDPVSLLREGQFEDVIADVCKLSIDEVRGIAKVIGVTPAVRGDITAGRGPMEPALKEADAKMLDGAAASPKAEPNMGPIKISKATRNEVVRLFEEEHLGASEISQRLGKGLLPQHVSQILRKSRQPQ